MKTLGVSSAACCVLSVAGAALAVKRRKASPSGAVRVLTLCKDSVRLFQECRVVFFKQLPDAESVGQTVWATWQLPTR